MNVAPKALRRVRRLLSPSGPPGGRTAGLAFVWLKFRYRWSVWRAGGQRPGEAPHVSFLICGTQKGGTTALAEYLRLHPEIQMARTKELHFFDNEKNFAGGAPDYDDYHACFHPIKPGALLGEATPIYMYWRDAARRIQAYNPRIKIVMILRNPVDRAYSHWNMERARGQESLSFQDALEAEPARARAALPLQHRVYSYVDRGFYSLQIRRFWELFGREQVLVLLSEELKSSPQATLAKVHRFLGVKEIAPPQALVRHALNYDTPMTPQERNRLNPLFESDISELERMLDIDLTSWRSPA